MTKNDVCCVYVARDLALDEIRESSTDSLISADFALSYKNINILY